MSLNIVVLRCAAAGSRGFGKRLSESERDRVGRPIVEALFKLGLEL